MRRLDRPLSCACYIDSGCHAGAAAGAPNGPAAAPTRSAIVGRVDLAHVAFAKEGGNMVRAEPGTDCKRHMKVLYRVSSLFVKNDVEPARR